MQLDNCDEGVWLVIKNGSCTTTRPVAPDYVELDAALHFLQDRMTEVMMEKSKLQSTSVKMSKKEIKAWKAFDKVMGKDHPTRYTFPSMHDIADAGCKYIKSKIKSSVSKKVKIKKIKEYKPLDPILSLDII